MLPTIIKLQPSSLVESPEEDYNSSFSANREFCMCNFHSLNFLCDARLATKFLIQYMNLIIIAAFAIFIIATLQREIAFAHHLGFFTFDQDVNKRETYLPHIQSSIVLHSLVSLEVSSYFSYDSSWDKIQGANEDKLIIEMDIKGTNKYIISIQYVVLQQMPNVDVIFINLTWAKPQKLIQSYKGLIFGDSTELTAHLIGFSSSNFTHQNYFFAMKGKNSYNVYTGINLTNQNWVAVNLIIIESNYQKDEIICQGSRIHSEVEISFNKSSVRIQSVSGLPYFLGLQAIHKQKCSFIFDPKSKNIKINEGSYSYSVVTINTTCIQNIEKTLKLSRKALIYATVMSIFAFLSTVLFLLWISYCIYKKYLKKSQLSAETSPELNQIQDQVQGSQLRDMTDNMHEQQLQEPDLQQQNQQGSQRQER